MAAEDSDFVAFGMKVARKHMTCPLPPGMMMRIGSSCS